MSGKKNSNKQLLSESAMRRFGKIAGIDESQLEKHFVKEDDEEQVNEEAGKGAPFGSSQTDDKMKDLKEGMDEFPPEDEEEVPPEMPGEEPEMPPVEDEMPMDAEPGMEEGPMGNFSEEDVAQIVDAIADAVSQVTGVDVEGPGADAEMGEEMPGEELPAEEPEMEMEPEEGMPPEEEEEEEEVMEGRDGIPTPPAPKGMDELVENVTKRVVARLMEASKKS
jgi:hypothetical protein